MFIDAHCHIFTDRILANVRERPAMLEELKLNTHDARPRLAPKALQESAVSNEVDLCVLLPSAAPDRVRSENDRFIRFTEEFPRLRTFATLHPGMEDFSREIARIYDRGIYGFKFSSFSQRFDPAADEVTAMLNEVERPVQGGDLRPALVFDTFVAADVHFNAQPDHLTTPSKLAGLALRHEGINFIAAHMGGLLADFDELRRDLLPAPNLYLDTANAGHTFSKDEFVELLQIHGPSHILFGTDWPWFTHAQERSKIGSLLTEAGYSRADQAAVFGGNAKRLFGL